MADVIVTKQIDVFVIDGQCEQIVAERDIYHVVESAEQGPPGPPGPPGPAGGSTYQHHQDTPLAVWTIAHNLNRYPAVTVTDHLGRVVVGDVEFLDANVVRITHGDPIIGYAYLN